MKSKETLGEALKRTGDKEHLKHLNKEAKKLTKKDISKLLNSKVDEDLSVGTIKALRKLSKQRIMEGKSAFPWDKMEDVKHNEADDNMGGGTW
ncbi:MAG: ferredoxin-fold anticodon binding domain-containing protein [Arcticibacterium sp.]|jgi:ferredoxin-fold anticodon binding domain-containing protein